MAGRKQSVWRGARLAAAGLAVLVGTGGMLLTGCEKPASENVKVETTAPQGDGSGAQGGANQLPQGAEGPGGGGAPPR